jgi:hypothetical protein
LPTKNKKSLDLEQEELQTKKKGANKQVQGELHNHEQDQRANN